MTAAKTKAAVEEIDRLLAVPTFTYTPAGGGEPIVFPASSTVMGEVDGVGMLEFLWEMYEDELSDTDQMFAWLKRSGADREMKRRVVRLPADELPKFFSGYFDDAKTEALGGLPGES